MTTDPGYMHTRASASQSVNHWSRILGVSLRPWSGHSPLKLIITGVIQLVIFILVLVFSLRMRTEFAVGVESSAEMGTFLLLMSVVFGLFILVAGARILLGVIDLVPRIKVQGVVESIEERKTGDILPYAVQQMIFNRNNTLDQRRSRTELVLRTDSGQRQWTVRSGRVRRQLRVGQLVTITVSPLLGHIAHVETSQV